MKWMADQYFGRIGNEFPRRDAPIGSCRLNLPGRKDCGEEKNTLLAILQQEKEEVEENLTATYWG